MADSYHVLAREELSVPRPAVSRAVAHATGRVAFDVARELRRRIGVLADGLSREAAEQLVAALAQVGVRAFALEDDQVVRFPDPGFLETARLGPDALIVSDLRDAEQKPIGSANVPYGDIVLLATAMVTTETKRKVSEPDHLTGGGGLIAAHAVTRGIIPLWPLHGNAKPARRTERRLESDYFLDLFAVEPARHLRLNAGTFNFVQTGLKMEPTSIANLRRFIEAFVPRCDQAIIDPSVRHVLDGSPQTDLRCDGLEQYDAYLAWRVQLLYHPEPE